VPQWKEIGKSVSPFGKKIVGVPSTMTIGVCQKLGSEQSKKSY
jgi:hypothetical protein